MKVGIVIACGALLAPCTSACRRTQAAEGELVALEPAHQGALVSLSTKVVSPLTIRNRSPEALEIKLASTSCSCIKALSTEWIHVAANALMSVALEIEGRIPGPQTRNIYMLARSNGSEELFIFPFDVWVGPQVYVEPPVLRFLASSGQQLEGTVHVSAIDKRIDAEKVEVRTNDEKLKVTSVHSAMSLDGAFPTFVSSISLAYSTVAQVQEEKVVTIGMYVDDVLCVEVPLTLSIIGR